MFGRYFNDHIVLSILLIGPEGAAIFAPLVFRKEGIEGVWRRVCLAIFVSVVATAAAVAVALFGKPALHRTGIELGAVAAFGGFISIYVGATVFGLDFLKPFRMHREEASTNGETSKLRVPEARGMATPIAGKQGIIAVVRDLFRDFMRVAVLVFPTSVGPAYIAWLFMQAGSAPVISLMTVIVVSMLVALVAMLVVLLPWKKWIVTLLKKLHLRWMATVLDKLHFGWMATVLEKAGAIIFILFGIGTFVEGIVQLVLSALQAAS